MLLNFGIILKRTNTCNISQLYLYHFYRIEKQGAFKIKKRSLSISDSSAIGDTVIAVATSEPGQKLTSIHFSPMSTMLNSNFGKAIPLHLLKTSFSMVSPGRAVAGSGRNIASVSNFEPFPFFMPINIDFGLSNTASFSDWIKNVEKFYEPTFAGKGEFKTVTTVNSNGHVHGKVKTVSFDKIPNSDVKIVSSESSV